MVRGVGPDSPMDNVRKALAEVNVLYALTKRTRDPLIAATYELKLARLLASSSERELRMPPTKVTD